MSGCLIKLFRNRNSLIGHHHRPVLRHHHHQVCLRRRRRLYVVRTKPLSGADTACDDELSSDYKQINISAFLRSPVANPNILRSSAFHHSVTVVFLFPHISSSVLSDIIGLHFNTVSSVACETNSSWQISQSYISVGAQSTLGGGIFA